MVKAKPAYSLLLAVFITSACSLAYEVLLIRLFSIIQWHHFAYLIISLALLGYGVSGVFLAFNRARLTAVYPRAIFANLVLFALSVPGCFWIAQQIPFNSVQILWSIQQFWFMCALYVLLALPFFFAANVIGLTFYQYRQDASLIYAADLCGAGIGSLSIIGALFVLLPDKILFVLAGFGLSAAMLVMALAFRGAFGKASVWMTLFMLVALSAFGLLSDMSLTVSPYKDLNQLLRIPGTRVVEQYSSPLGLLSVVESTQMPLRHAPGLSLNADSEPPPQLGVFTDADNMSAITQYDGNPETISHLDQTTSALPYHLQKLHRVLILGAGTGSDVLQARYHGIEHIDAVELNPQIVDLVKKKYAGFAGQLYDPDHVTVHIAEARGFVATSREQFDLIAISLLDAFGASAAGLYALSETYLYTEQAIAEYLRHLKPGGYLGLTRWIKVPPRDLPKLIATVKKALTHLKVNNPERNIVLIRSWQTGTLLVKNGAFSDSEIAELKHFCEARSFDTDYYPDINATEVNRFNIMQEPYYYQAATALLVEQGEDFIADYKFNIEPSTDDRPYFFHFFKWRTLPEILSLLGQGGISLLESGYLLLLIGLVQAASVSLILIVVPLALWKRKLGISSGSRRHFRVLSYFSCLGLAFLFIEIAFIQKFILVMHHPLYAMTVVVSTFLLSAGIGSHYSKKLSETIEKSMIIWPIAGISLVSTLYILSFEGIIDFLLQMNDLTKIICSVGLIAPLGFCMGMPFPMGLSSLSRTTPELIPWAWGVNGCASVVSAILATLIAMQFGFTVLVFMALGLYGLAALSFPGSVREG
ncbi:MAG: SAM-dependent methyltransferase [Methylicorpusculum sp.]|uniref:spermine/spermidine synthase domain-containing protein n=1 Tax=Methylicorpusculum sp. TaxID=2713644 RepID=UPI0027217A4D|nr:SAM-dependent methyltransferase [Methylicorpusculum sp.]MDO8938803.1 SAM-dependent methyltransferase [Methylicorpusculum sp.]MDP2180002.1 SAM-dependent methyltransferase [Methylicorpusculum sp.]MDP2202853.1 SAM-dependent methyltransferase [Methylicorpusculum sp.]MDP3528640.1 SAM-dependent methyltransferase [Methylicorpusculum sp.]MDZ4149928.1 SAM-dependent methyltransferase [Methylicorpusculum sp.]